MNTRFAKPHAILPLGDTAAFIEFSEILDLDANAAAQNLAHKIRSKSLRWIIDIVPALGGVALHFDIAHPELPDSPLEATQRLVSEALSLSDEVSQEPNRLVEIPVCYEAEFGLDLADIAARVGLSVEEVIQRHCAAEYQVLMMGFVPGGPYMGGLDPAINLPRRSSPRTKVLQGSVALANLQVVIYPFTTPGGWHIVGRTPSILFNANRNPASLLSPQDRVRFMPISAKEFRRLDAQEAKWK
jgi:inhibitor of KinA